jgi:hypothetical protein
MIDKYSGQVAYAVMSFGGFLGIGERYHALPWRMLTYDTGLGGYVVDVTREQLERAPTYARDETPWSGLRARHLQPLWPALWRRTLTRQDDAQLGKDGTHA